MCTPVVAKDVFRTAVALAPAVAVAPAGTAAAVPIVVAPSLNVTFIVGPTVLLLAVVLPLFFGLSYDPDDTSTRFPTLLGVWTLGVMVLFSWAGEKMPWLTMHFAIPLSARGNRSTMDRSRRKSDRDSFAGKKVNPRHASCVTLPAFRRADAGPENSPACG